MGIPTPGDDRAAIVTGASSGIGEAIALELARRGHQLVLVARRTDRLHALAGSLSTKAHVLTADLSSRTDRAALPGRVAALGLAPDILINNAGLSVGAHVAKSVPEQQLNLVEVDVAAVVDLCSRFLPGMVERGRGAVLNVSSLAGFYPLPGQAAYGAAKAFVLSYTESLRQRVARHRCHSHCIVSGTGRHRIGRRSRVQRRATCGRVTEIHVEVRRRGRTGWGVRNVGREQGPRCPGSGKSARRGVLSGRRTSGCCRCFARRALPTKPN